VPPEVESPEDSPVSVTGPSVVSTPVVGSPLDEVPGPLDVSSTLSFVVLGMVMVMGAAVVSAVPPVLVPSPVPGVSSSPQAPSASTPQAVKSKVPKVVVLPNRMGRIVAESHRRRAVLYLPVRGSPPRSPGGYPHDRPLPLAWQGDRP
jgi:hypothetical protein